jgi:CRISPR type III-A-associated RAMP protein Csm4
MLPALLIRLRPVGPWRFGPSDGARHRTDRILHSDSLYSAVTNAIASVGPLEEWLDETARSAMPAVRFTSVFPYMGRHTYITPPRSLWPPPPTSKVPWKQAKLIPLQLVQSLLRGEAIDEQKWAVDPVSECLLPIEKNFTGVGPFRVSLRTRAAVDRLEQGRIAVHATACLEFADQCGLWCAAAFADEAAKNRWTPVLRAAFKFLADEGMGGERSAGWGRAKQPRFEDSTLSQLFFPGEGVTDPVFWMLSLYSPAEGDGVDWAEGKYEVTTRSHAADPSRGLRLVSEGSVIRATRIPTGQAFDLASNGSPHPRYRSGLAVGVPIPSAITSVDVTPAPGAEEPVAPPSPELAPLAALNGGVPAEPAPGPETESEPMPEAGVTEPGGPDVDLPSDFVLSEPIGEVAPEPPSSEPAQFAGDDWNQPNDLRNALAPATAPEAGMEPQALQVEPRPFAGDDWNQPNDAFNAVPEPEQSGETAAVTWESEIEPEPSGPKTFDAPEAATADTETTAGAISETRDRSESVIGSDTPADASSSSSPSGPDDLPREGQSSEPAIDPSDDKRGPEGNEVP